MLQPFRNLRWVIDPLVIYLQFSHRVQASPSLAGARVDNAAPLAHRSWKAEIRQSRMSDLLAGKSSE